MRVDVRRSGGFAGITKAGSAELADDDAHALAETVTAAAATADRPVPDAFNYHVRVGDQEWTVGEHALPAELRTRLQRILDAPQLP